MHRDQKYDQNSIKFKINKINFFLKILFIYLTEREITSRQREAERERKGSRLPA